MIKKMILLVVAILLMGASMTGCSILEKGIDEYSKDKEECLLKQTASGAQSVTSPSKIEGFREFEADLSALFFTEISCEEVDTVRIMYFAVFCYSTFNLIGTGSCSPYKVRRKFCFIRRIICDFSYRGFISFPF